MSELWRSWHARFEYWRKFCQTNNPSVETCKDWWLSRFSDEHRWGYNPDGLWNLYIAPALNVNTKPYQMPLDGMK
jgi:hypothetical protein